LEIVSSRRSSMFAALDRFLSVNNISRELRLKVQRNARHSLGEEERNTLESKIDLLRLITEPLMMQLHMEMFFPSLSACPFLRCLKAENESTVKQLCHTAVTVDRVSKDDVIFSEGESPMNPRCLLVQTGELIYTRKPAECITHCTQLVSSKDWLCEACLWCDEWVHLGTLTATTECQIVSLNAKHFQEIVANPTDGVQARQYAEIYINELNEAQQGDLSDIGDFTEDMEETLEIIFAKAAQVIAMGRLSSNTSDAVRHTMSEGPRRQSSRRISKEETALDKLADFVGAKRRVSTDSISSRRKSTDSAASRRTSQASKRTSQTSEKRMSLASFGLGGMRRQSQDGTNQVVPVG